MLGYVDKPNHQAWMPDYQKSRAALKAVYNKYRTTAGLDIDAELAHAEDDPPGHLRRLLQATRSFTHRVPGGARPPGTHPAAHPPRPSHGARRDDD